MAAEEGQGLLTTALNRSIVDISSQQAAAALGNHTSQINNFGRAAEWLSKTMVEIDPMQALSVAEANTRFSPASQVHDQAQGITSLGASLQNNQNYISQALAQVLATTEALKMQMMQK